MSFYIIFSVFLEKVVGKKMLKNGWAFAAGPFRAYVVQLKLHGSYKGLFVFLYIFRGYNPYSAKIRGVGGLGAGGAPPLILAEYGLYARNMYSNREGGGRACPDNREGGGYPVTRVYVGCPTKKKQTTRKSIIFQKKKQSQIFPPLLYIM